MGMMEEIKKKVVRKIHDDIRYIIESGLLGVTKPVPSFDLGKVDYRIDNDNLNARLELIAEKIVLLTIDSLYPILYHEIKEIVEDGVKKKIEKLL